MNEILKKRIEEAADTEMSQYYNDDEYPCDIKDIQSDFKEAFKRGAEYALSHQWISVDEALPEPEEEVVLFNKNSIRHYEIGWLRKEKEYSKSKWAITNGFVEDDDITHWMPIPKF